MKTILISILLLTSGNLFAAVEAQGIRTTTSFISKGDSRNTMFQVLGNPQSSYEYKTRDSNGRLAFATDFSYIVDGINYTITVIEGKITKIVWER